MLNERALKTRLIAGQIRRHSIDVLHKINQSFSKLNERSSGNAKIELDLSNQATKVNLKLPTDLLLLPTNLI